MKKSGNHHLNNCDFTCCGGRNILFRISRQARRNALDKVTITLPQGEAYTVIRIGLEFAVKGGISVSRDVSEDYLDDYMVVMCGDETLTPVDGVYTVHNVLEDTAITIQGMVYKAKASDFVFSDHIFGGEVIGKKINVVNANKPSIKLPLSANDIPVTGIGDNAFTNNGVISLLIIPEGYVEIGNYSFYGMTRLEKIIIPKSLERIGNYAFASSAALKEIEYPDDGELKVIGNYAFQNCDSITSAFIPSSVESVGQHAFGYMDGLTSVEVSSPP